jgi:hypothetical protein
MVAFSTKVTNVYMVTIVTFIAMASNTAIDILVIVVTLVMKVTNIPWLLCLYECSRSVLLCGHYSCQYLTLTANLHENF